MKVTIIGLGLIGGSIAKKVKECGFAHHTIGVDQSARHQEQALELELVDEIQPLSSGIENSSLIILAVPVDAAVELLPQLLNHISDSAVVIDMGSTKLSICKAVKDHANRKSFVASHPMAGTEYNGPKAARADLFDQKTAIICNGEESADFAIELASRLYNALNMKVIKMSAKEHDLHIAYVSHLSHITSFVLGQTVLEKEKEVEHIFNMAGSGFASTVRLAKSSPEMWSPIFLDNATHVSDVLGTYIDNLQKFKAMIDNKNSIQLIETMKHANTIQKVID